MKEKAVLCRGLLWKIVAVLAISILALGISFRSDTQFILAPTTPSSQTTLDRNPPFPTPAVVEETTPPATPLSRLSTKSDSVQSNKQVDTGADDYSEEETYYEDGIEDEYEDDSLHHFTADFEKVLKAEAAPPDAELLLAPNVTNSLLRESLIKLSRCRSYECVQECHDDLNGHTKFNFPHFFLIGWQKCATTSINAHLRLHPQYLPGLRKESHWFSACQNNVKNRFCLAETLRIYYKQFLRIDLAASGGLEAATVDASVDYAWKGKEKAEELYKIFPWIKIVMIMREPISRLISYSRMFTLKGLVAKGCKSKETHFECLTRHLRRSSPTYSKALEGWLEVFPPDQIHVIQFEEMKEDSDKVLHDLKVFLGMDPNLPVVEKLNNVNSRRGKGGYLMSKEEYKSLIDVVRPKAEEVANMLHKNGIADGDVWLGRWEAVWQNVLNESCDSEGLCDVNSN